ncbi:MAG: bifunctional demethylmenaquinone methyltransferase/2-methoxy-6-polyprenyl-1,4-benzoquinol methylase UbiE [Desulfobacterales bacterium]|nr:bifunctional demethylmenaquinone methyltransferase/2-methoxy-6-polyprenyl-1,4-benzoquinol methylase UbiE [Desulfobacterales bacterium]
MLEEKKIWKSETRRTTGKAGERGDAGDEKVKSVGRHFDSVARRYDFMNTLLSLGIHHLWKRTAIRTLGLKPGALVLDVCGGTGDLALLAADRVGESGQVALYDINRAMILEGRSKLRRLPRGGRIQYVQGDAEKISFPDRSFDAVMVGFGIRNVAHIEAGFKEMHRVLKPGGKMMCLEFSKPTAPLFRWLYDCYSIYIIPRLGGLITGSTPAYNHLTQSIREFPLPDELAAMLKSIGFSRVTIRKLTNGVSVIHLAEK